MSTQTDDSLDRDGSILDDYVGLLGAPEEVGNYDSADALRDSHLLGAHLAKCKIAEMQCDHDKLGKHLNQALVHHANLHCAIHAAAAARASELNPMRIRQEQQED